MRERTFFSVVAAVQLALTIALTAYTFGAGMRRFDVGGDATVAEVIGQGILTALSFPLVAVLEHVPGVRFPGLWGYIPFAANASLWGLAAVWVRRWLRARRGGVRRTR